MTSLPTMQESPLIILAITLDLPNAGYAVLDAGELLYSRVHTFTRRQTGRRTLAEGERFVRALIETFHPALLVMEHALHTQAERASLRHRLGEEMVRVALRNGLQVFSYTAATVKHAMTGDATATTQHVAETLVHLWYPHLESDLPTEASEEDRWWEPMVEAVALGVVAHYDVTGQPLPHPLVTASAL